MIRKLGAKNFFCFNDGFDIDFTFDGNVPESVRMNKDFGTVFGIKGANGSGKTNIIKAIEFLSDFCTRSTESDRDSEFYIDSYFFNRKPIEFYVEFEIGKKMYFYEVELVNNKVLKEILYRKRKRLTKILERTDDEIVYAISDLKELKTIKIRSNASIISTAEKFNFKSQMKDVYMVWHFFRQILSNVNYLGYRKMDFKLDKISKEYSKDSKLFDFVKSIIISSDSGLKDIEIHTRKDEKNQDIYFPIFIRESNGEDKNLTYFSESKGIQTLYRRMQYYWLVLVTGGLLALDEFDIHLHALLLPKILDLFINKKTNKFGAQLIFTAHNTEIIDKLGKYRTILVNKEDNESYCYRLDEIPGSMVRNDRAITPLYLEGKLGGIPLEKVI